MYMFSSHVCIFHSSSYKTSFPRVIGVRIAWHIVILYKTLCTTNKFTGNVTEKNKTTRKELRQRKLKFAFFKPPSTSLRRDDFLTCTHTLLLWIFVSWWRLLTLFWVSLLWVSHSRRSSVFSCWWSVLWWPSPFLRLRWTLACGLPSSLQLSPSCPQHLYIPAHTRHDIYELSHGNGCGCYAPQHDSCKGLRNRFKFRITIPTRSFKYHKINKIVHTPLHSHPRWQVWRQLVCRQKNFQPTK